MDDNSKSNDSRENGIKAPLPNETQLGLGDTNNRSSPVQVGSLSSWIKISGNGYHTIVLKS